MKIDSPSDARNRGWLAGIQLFRPTVSIYSRLFFVTSTIPVQMAIAIGDIHGCLDTLKALVSALPESGELVFLGDYVDRGPDSAGVVKYLKALAAKRPCRFLKGNHEEMMLNAVHEPGKIASWMFNGGVQTLRSYGEAADSWGHSGDRGRFLEHDLDFFESLEIYYEDDDSIFVHAGIDVAIADMNLQEAQVMLWIRDKFIRSAHLWEGKMVVFGHTPTHNIGLKGKAVFTAPRARGIDTGCCFGGYLTAYDTKSGELYQVKSKFGH